MAVATVGALALALYEQSGDYTEAIAVMLFYQVGEWFQSYAVGKSRRNISELMDIRPDYANVENEGKLEQVDPDEVEIGTIIVVQPGEKVPIDGVVVEGSSSLNTAALTGESLPREVHAGDEIISGCINMTGPAEDPHHQRVWGVHRLQDPGSGGKRQLPQVQVRGLYLQVRSDLHPCWSVSPLWPWRFSRLWCACLSGAFLRSWDQLGLPGADLPGHQLPLRAGHQHPAQLLRRHRRRQQRRRAGEGFQLLGDSLPDKGGGL